MSNFKTMMNNYKKLLSEALTDLKTKGRRHKQIPNLLTATRLIAAPFFIIPAAIMGNVPLILLFTVAFSLTDAVDGFIARRWNLVSELGKDLDAICDKVFAGTLLLATSLFNPVLLCNLFFEALIAIVNAKEKVEGHKPRSLYIGKIKTCVLYPLLGAGLINQFINISEIFNILLVATTTMQLVTIASYTVAYDTKTGETIKKVEEKIEQHDEELEKREESKEKVLVKDIGEKNQDSKKKELQEMRDIIAHEIEINRKEEVNTGEKTLRK